VNEIIKFLIEVLLSLYGYFKLDDFEYPENSFTIFIERIENYSLIGFLFGYKPYTDEFNKSTELKTIDSMQSSPISEQAMSPQRILEMNDAITIKIDKILSFVNQIDPLKPPKIYLCIRTFISQDVYISEKSFHEFYQLFTFLKEFEFPEKNKIQNFLSNLNFLEEDTSNSELMLTLISEFEEFLEKIVNKPFLSCNNEIWKFLKINKKNKKSITCFRMPRKLNRNIPLSPLILHIKKVESTPMSKTPGSFSEMSSSLLSKQVFFAITALDYKRNPIHNYFEYSFQITNLSQNPHQIWVISKTYNGFRQLNNDLEKQTNSKISFFQKIVPKLSNPLDCNEPQFLMKRKEGLLKYLEFVVKNLDFRGEVLNKFLNFDPENWNNTPINNFALSALLVNNSEKPFDKSKEGIIFSHVFEEKEQKKTIYSSSNFKKYQSAPNVMSNFSIYFQIIYLNCFNF